MLKVYHLKLTADQPESLFYSWVSADTLEAVKTIRHEKIRRSKLAGEAMIRQIVENLRGKVPYDILRGEYGKPYLSGISPQLHFNISHSGEYIVVAFSDQETGIDIEKKTDSRLNVARRFFHPGELACLEQAAEEEQRQLFFNYWAAKESYLKYTGSGLSAPLSGFQVCFRTGGAVLLREGQLLPVHVQCCPIDPDYACFLTSGLTEKAEILPLDLRF